MLLIYFALLCIIIAIISNIISNNFLNPVSLLCYMFCFSSSLAISTLDKWRWSLSLKTFLVLISGILSFALVYFWVFKTTIHSKKNNNFSIINRKPIKIYFGEVLILLLMYFVCICCFFFAFIQTVGISDSLSTMTSIYRNSKWVGEMELPYIGRLSTYLLRGMSNVLCYVLVNNYVSHGLKRNYSVIMALLVLAYLVVTLITGERTSTLRVFALLIFLYDCLSSKKDLNIKK